MQSSDTSYKPLNGKIVTIFGGSGFLGRYAVRALAKEGWRIRIATRRPDLAYFLQPLGGVGQIQTIQANIRDAASVKRAVKNSDAVINMTGILFETGAQRFEAIQHHGAETIAMAAKEEGLKAITHISAIGADKDSTSSYAVTKALGEEAILKHLPDSIILRPSIVFGAEDNFINRFASMATLSPIIPLIGGDTHFQPVFVGDIAKAVVKAVKGEVKAGTLYELGGAEKHSFKNIIKLVLSLIGRKRLIVDIPIPLAKIQAKFLQLLPSPPLTVDQVKLLSKDNIVSEHAIAENRTLTGLGINPSGMEAILENYLWPYRDHGQFGQAFPNEGERQSTQ